MAPIYFREKGAKMRNVALVLTLATVASLLAQSSSSYHVTHSYLLGGDGDRKSTRLPSGRRREKRSQDAQRSARPYAGYRSLTARAVILVLPRHPQLFAGRRWELGLRCARSAASPPVYRPAESGDGRR